MPDLMIGYFNQSLEEMPGMDGIQLGISAPIFFWGNQSESASAKRERAIEEARYQELLLALRSEETRLWKELEKHQGELNWYEETGRDVANELQRYAMKAYENGSIGYMEFLDSLEEARALRESNLKAIKNYNQTIVQINFLRGTF
jgi:cobalt-zinc-cadmium resistance protein CzcA